MTFGGLRPLNIFANMQTIESQSHRQICLDYIIIIKIISNLLFLDSFEGLHPFRSSLFANMQNIERQTDLFRLFVDFRVDLFLLFFIVIVVGSV